MKKFQFSLDTVLRYKQQVLDGLQNEYAAAALRVQQQEERLRQAEASYRDLNREFRAAAAEGITDPTHPLVRSTECISDLVYQTAQARPTTANLAMVDTVSAQLCALAKFGNDDRLVRVMTYNVHFGQNMGNNYVLQSIANVITDSGADIVCLQEVDVNWGERSNFDDTLAMPSLLTIASLHFFAKTSTANLLLISVAVVITGVAFISAANNTASSLAPPICPERIGITNFPSSSITITGLSLSLLFTVFFF